jgi:hypothetical protein
MSQWVGGFRKEFCSQKGSEKIKKSLSPDMSLSSGRELVGERDEFVMLMI